MAGLVLVLNLDLYPNLKSLVSTQKVKFELAGEVINTSTTDVLVRVSSLNLLEKSNLSTQEILLQNLNERIKDLPSQQPSAQPTP